MATTNNTEAKNNIKEEELYLKREEVTNLRATLCQLLSKLYNAATTLNPDGYNQVVLQLDPDKDGMKWLMFVYYDAKREYFYYSFQDENYEDTDFTLHKTMMEAIEDIEREVAKVGGFEWIAMDQD